MPFQFYTGRFTRPSPNPPDGIPFLQQITGVGFQPALLLIIGDSVSTLDTYRADIGMYFGLASSSDTSKQRSFLIRDFDNESESFCETHWNTTSTLSDDPPPSGGGYRGVLYSFDSDGFTIQWTIQGVLGVGLQFSYIVIGGDVSDATVGHFNAPSTTGEQAVTGLGFIPDFVFLLGTNMTADDTIINEDSNPEYSSYSFGCFNGVGEQAVTSLHIRGKLATTDTARYQRTDKCLAMFTTNNTSTLTHEAEFVGMGESDGFVINYTTASVANKRVAYLAFKGCKTKISTITSPTVGSLPVTQATTGLALAPRAIMFSTVCATHSTSIQTNARQCFGFASAIDNRSSKWIGDRDNVADTITASMTDSDQVIRVGTEAASAGSSTTQALADFVSFDEDGFTLDWDVIDGSNAYEIVYITFADAEAPPPITSFSSTNLATGGAIAGVAIQTADLDHIETIVE